MRSVAAGSFERLSAFEALWTAWQACRRGKRRKPSFAAFDLEADLRILGLHRDLRAGRYRPSPYHVTLVRDPKTRLVAAPSMVDRALQRALLDTIGPTYERGFIDHSYAVCAGRGPHRAVLAYLGWMRRYRYRLHLDIRHYFASVDHAILLALFARRLQDPDTLDLLAKLLAAGGRVYRHPLAGPALGADSAVAGGRGLPLGGYLSHWSGGFYLDGLDHYVKRVLKLPAYLRYMDDLVLFADEPGWLEVCATDISDWLASERRLLLKEPEATPLQNARPAIFLGFRVSRAGIGPGPKARRRLRIRLRQADALGPERLARSLRAYRGIWSALGEG
jgi:hypothetical protein